MKKIFTALCFVLVASLSCLAQETYTWKKHKIEATFTKGMKIYQTDGEKVTITNGTAALDFLPLSQKTIDKTDDDDMMKLIPQIAENLEIDLEKAAKEEYECINGAGVCIIAPHKTKDMYGVIALSASNEGNPYRYFIIAGLFTEEDSDDIEEIISNLNYKN
ncbi:MAG: hypothetical protein J5595_03325 [Bacteroidales bacterium]|nr:hypothetical protein [Bacteroidales bacterium]